VSKIPQEVIDDLMNDNDFLSLSDQEQDEILDKIGSKFGETPRTENILQRMAKAAVKPFMPPSQSDPLTGAFQMGGMAPVLGAYGAREELLGEIKNPVTRFGVGVATDPLTYMGGGAAAKNVASSGKKAVSEVGPFMKSIGKLRKMEKGDTALQEGFRKSLFKNRAKLSTEFEKDLSNLPDATHDISDMVQRIASQAQFNPSVQSQIGKSSMMQNLIRHPELGRNISTKEFQALRNEFGKGVNYSSGKVDSSVRDILDDLRFKQAEPFPEAMASMREKYGKGIEAFKEVRPMFSKKSLEGNIRKGFGNAEVKKALKEAAPEVADEMLQIGKHATAANTGYSIAKGLGLSGAGLGALKWLSGKKE